MSRRVNKAPSVALAWMTALPASISRAFGRAKGAGHLRDVRAVRAWAFPFNAGRDIRRALGRGNIGRQFNNRRAQGAGSEGL